jgi:hypothetical protein
VAGGSLPTVDAGIVRFFPSPSRSFSIFPPAGIGFSTGLAAPAPASSMVATTSPIFTSVPAGTLMCRTPGCSAVISEETLSVSSVRSASPMLTRSPSFLCQTERSPVVMDSPTDGILTSKLMDRFERPTFRGAAVSYSRGVAGDNSFSGESLTAQRCARNSHIDSLPR